MKKMFFVFAAAALLTACGGEEPATDGATPAGDSTAVITPTEPEGPAMLAYGEEITPDEAMSTADFIAALGDEAMMEGKVAASINACCQKKGCWMTVNLDNGDEMRVTFKDYGFFAPMNSSGAPVIMQGKAYYDTVSVDMLKHFAEDEGKPQEEIDAITEAEVSLAFEATGILVEMSEEPNVYMPEPAVEEN